VESTILYDGKAPDKKLSHLLDQVSSMYNYDAYTKKDVRAIVARMPKLLEKAEYLVQKRTDELAEKEEYHRALRERYDSMERPESISEENWESMKNTLESQRKYDINVAKAELENEQTHYRSLQLAQEASQDIDWNKLEIDNRRGRLYEVTLAPDDDQLLDWDQPYDGQPSAVQALLFDTFNEGPVRIEAITEQLKKIAPVVYDNGGILDVQAYGEWQSNHPEDYELAINLQREKQLLQEARDGLAYIFEHSTAQGNVYKALEHQMGPQDASLFLSSIGIPGIKFLDGSSRRRGHGDYNYVIFDDKDVVLDAKYSRRATTIPTAKIPAKGPRRERRYSANTATNQNMHPDLQKSFALNPLIYRQLMNTDTLDAAMKKYNNITDFEVAYTDYLKHLDKLDPSDVPLGAVLANHFMKQGQPERAVEMISAIAEKMTQAGQFAQAANILRDTGNPAYMLRTIARQIRDLNEQGKRLYPGKWKEVTLRPEEVQALNDAFDGAVADHEKWNVAVQSIHDRIAREMPVGGMEKVNAWRRMAMLLNIKTHIRNVVGNTVMLVNSRIKDMHATAIERMFIKDRTLWTHALNWKDDPSRVAITKRYWEQVSDDLRGVHKYELDKATAFHREKTIFGKGAPTRLAEKLTGKTFDRGILESVNKGLSWLLDIGDVPFMGMAFRRALGMEMKAQGVSTPTGEMVERAKERALEDTFKQMNGLSRAIRNAKRQGGTVGFLTEAAVPFDRTHAAIAKLGIQYSPFGALYAAPAMYKAFFAPDADIRAQGQRDSVDIFSKMFTGTEVIALGFVAAMLGLAKGASDDEGKEKALKEQLLGEKDYTIITKKGAYTYDWLQPSAIPFAIGATLGTKIAERDDLDGATILEAAVSAGDTVFNLGMLQNIRMAMGNSYESPTMSLADMSLSFFEQMAPTIGGSFARVADPIKRSTYKSGDLFGNFVRGMQSKTIWSKNLPAKYDVYGREMLHNRAGGDPGNNFGATNFLNQFISPGYAINKPNDAVTEEIVRMYDIVQDTDILPREAPKTFSYDTVKYELSMDEQSELQRVMGQAVYRELKALMNTTRYRNGVDDATAAQIKAAKARGVTLFVRSKEIEKVIERSYEIGKAHILKSRGVVMK
jgi:hypothetical protein